MRNYFKKSLYVNKDNVNKVNNYANLNEIYIEDVFDFNVKFDDYNKIEKIYVYNKPIIIHGCYNLNNLIVKDDMLLVQLISEYDSVLKAYKVDKLNKNIDRIYRSNIVIKPRDKWIHNNTLIIPKCDGVYNLKIDEDFSIIKTIDLRNIKDINGINVSNCMRLKNIIINDSSKQNINIDFKNTIKDRSLDRITLTIENSSIISSFGNKKVNLQFNKDYNKELFSIKKVNEDYIIEYGDNIDNPLVLKVTPDLKLYDFLSSKYISSDEFDKSKVSSENINSNIVDDIVKNHNSLFKSKTLKLNKKGK